MLQFKRKRTERGMEYRSTCGAFVIVRDSSSAVWELYLSAGICKSATVKLCDKLRHAKEYANGMQSEAERLGLCIATADRWDMSRISRATYDRFRSHPELSNPYAKAN